MPFSKCAFDEDCKRRTGSRPVHRSVGPGDPTYGARQGVRREKVSGLFFGSSAGAEGRLEVQVQRD
jgi:hypothetical protein